MKNLGSNDKYMVLIAFFNNQDSFCHLQHQLQVILFFLMHMILSAKPQNTKQKERKIMANTQNGSNQGMVPEARAAMDRFKMEAAAEVGVNLKEGYNGDLTSRQAGSVGGQMVKKMIESYEQKLAGQG
jgi:small acid-soluble spore protein D (minor alpha/beta-type SASP)